MQLTCPSCKTNLSSYDIGYENRDVSLSHMDLGFIDIFSCKKCYAVLSINRDK